MHDLSQLTSHTLPFFHMDHHCYDDHHKHKNNHHYPQTHCTNDDVLLLGGVIRV